MPDALLMGKKTYEWFAQIWPTRQGKDPHRMNGMPKYVIENPERAPAAARRARNCGGVMSRTSPSTISAQAGSRGGYWTEPSTFA